MHFLCKARPSKITKEKHKNAKKNGTKEVVKGTIVYIRELRREGGLCFLDSAGKKHGGWFTLFTALLMSANDCKNTRSIDLGGYKEISASSGICNDRLHE